MRLSRCLWASRWILLSNKVNSQVPHSQARKAPRAPQANNRVAIRRPRCGMNIPLEVTW